PLPFTLDGDLKRNVDFWISINTKYFTNQGLVHDAKNVDIVYEILDFNSGEKNKLIRASKKRYRELLLALHKKQAKGPVDVQSLSADEKRVYTLFLRVPERDKFLDAAHRRRLRFQLGQRDRFVVGLRESGRYLPWMEEIFRKRGLPVELTRLPFVESSFNVQARSKVGASGIWQFMRSTGRLFLKINTQIDERNDPMRATEAAAELLRVNFQSLGSWPLAVTAYNHGRQGLMRAVRKVGSDDIEDIVDEYRSRSFGFASSNFYSELVAAIEIERNAERYFGPIERAKPMRTYEFKRPDEIRFKDLVELLRLDRTQVVTLNPGLMDSVIRGRTLMPTGYLLRLPLVNGETEDSAKRNFQAGYDAIPKQYKRSRRPASLTGDGANRKDRVF
ncbi:MAG: lytic transglycosylase domain-containing protein, partial [Bdellovibrionota bacterium]